MTGLASRLFPCHWRLAALATAVRTRHARCGPGIQFRLGRGAGRVARWHPAIRVSVFRDRASRQPRCRLPPAGAGRARLTCAASARWRRHLAGSRRTSGPLRRRRFSSVSAPQSVAASLPVAAAASAAAAAAPARARPPSSKWPTRCSSTRASGGCTCCAAGASSPNTRSSSASIRTATSSAKATSARPRASTSWSRATRAASSSSRSRSRTRTARTRAVANESGHPPGGLIMIHGQPNVPKRAARALRDARLDRRLHRPQQCRHGRRLDAHDASASRSRSAHDDAPGRGGDPGRPDGGRQSRRCPRHADRQPREPVAAWRSTACSTRRAAASTRCIAAARSRCSTAAARPTTPARSSTATPISTSTSCARPGASSSNCTMRRQRRSSTAA